MGIITGMRIPRGRSRRAIGMTGGGWSCSDCRTNSLGDLLCPLLP